MSSPERPTEPVDTPQREAPRLEIAVELEDGKTVSRTLVLDGDVLRIGSHESNELVLDDPQVSRFHCQLRAHPKAWRLLDTGSLNGTHVNGVRIRDVDVTLPSCRIEVGQSAFVVRMAASVPGASAVHGSPAFGDMYGASPVMRRMFARLEQLARVDGDVLIEGESGTGKELIAAEIVRRSARAKKPFIVVDCGAMSRTLMESELFGHARGAFTGAEVARMGAFEAAEGGTVFLDEIGELPLDMQPKLLRALAARTVRRLGSNEPRQIDVRVIAATNRRLEAEVNSGRFREDLFFRLGVLRVDVPPLRERPEDIPLLVGTFLEQLGRPEKMAEFTPAVVAELAAHRWPGNVRELRNFVERYVVFNERESLLAPTTPPAGSSLATPAQSLDVGFREAKDMVLEDFEKTYLRSVLDWAQGNVSKAARKAKLDRMYLHRLLQKHGIRRAGALPE